MKSQVRACGFVQFISILFNKKGSMMLEVKNEEEKMVAPCGMNCTYCYAHYKTKKSCLGCRLSDYGKPEHCRKCNIKDCSTQKNLLFCYDCSEFPCLLIKRLDKSYRSRYDESLINNMNVIYEKGMSYYIEFEKNRLKCPLCGGVLNLHHKKCSDCKQVFKVPKLE